MSEIIRVIEDTTVNKTIDDAGIITNTTIIDVATDGTNIVVEAGSDDIVVNSTHSVIDVTVSPIGVPGGTGPKGDKGDTGSVVADFVFDDTANNGKTLGVDFTEVVSGDVATLTAIVDASGLATAEQGDKADTALQSFTEVNDVVAGESSYVDAIKETADAGGLSWSDVVISGLIVAKTTDDNGDKLYQMVFQSETYWRLFQTSPKANIIYKGSAFATAVEITRRG